MEYIEFTKGSVWQYENNKGVVKLCIVVSSNKRKNDKYISNLSLCDDARSSDDIKVSVNGVIQFAQPRMIGTCKSDQMIRKVGMASGSEMQRIDAAILDALGIVAPEKETDEPKAVVQVDDNQVVELKAKLEVYKELYNELMKKVVEMDG